MKFLQKILVAPYGGTTPLDSLTLSAGAGFVFTDSTTLNISSAHNVGSLYFGADVTFTGSSYINIQHNTFGTGKMILKDTVYIRDSSAEDLNLGHAIEVQGNNVIRPQGSSSKGYIITVSGALTGSGTLTCTDNTSSGISGSGSVRFTGDTSAFTGTVKIAPSNTSTHYSNISAAAAADNTLSSWEIYPDTKYVPTTDNAGAFPLRINGGTFKFGSLVANIPALATAADCKNITIEIGALDKGSYLGGDFASSTGATVKWIGSTSTFTNVCAGVANLEVTKANATIYLPSATGVPAAIDFKEYGGKIIATYSAKTALESALAASTVQPTIQYDVAELDEGDALDASNLAPECTIQITAANITKAGDTLVTVTSGTIPGDATYIVLSRNTGEESKFFTAEANSGGTAIVAAYKSGIYVWESATSYGTSATGWTLVGGSATATIGNQGCIVVFPDATEGENSAIEITKDKEPCGSVYFGRDVRFLPSTGNNQKRLLLQGSSGEVVAEGPGTIILNNGVKLMEASVNARVYSDVTLEGSTTTTWSAQNEKNLYFYGKLTGSADMTLDTNGTGNKKGSIHFYGDTASYTGTLTTNFGVDNSSVSFYAGEDGAYTFGGSLVLGSTGNTSQLCGAAGTYTFGSLSGKVKGPSNTGNVTIITGAAQTEAKTINYVEASSNPTTCNIKNVGAYDIAMTGNNFSSYTASGTGAFKLSSTLAQAATLTKVGSAANAKYPALVIEESDVDLTGLNLALEVPDSVSGWQYLVQATSFAASPDPTALSTYTKPTGRDNYNLKMKDSTILGATDATGITVIIAGDTKTEINDGNLETWLTGKGYTISDADIGTTVMTKTSGIAPLEAYLLGYDSATPTPTLGAEIAGDTITFNFAGTTPRSINGLGVSYSVQSSNDPSFPDSGDNAATTTDGASLSLSADTTKTYNRLVATITAVD